MVLTGGSGGFLSEAVGVVLTGGSWCGFDWRQLVWF